MGIYAPPLKILTYRCLHPLLFILGGKFAIVKFFRMRIFTCRWSHSLLLSLEKKFAVIKHFGGKFQKQIQGKSGPIVVGCQDISGILLTAPNRLNCKGKFSPHSSYTPRPEFRHVACSHLLLLSLGRKPLVVK
jgi:hypothetical protein